MAKEAASLNRLIFPISKIRVGFLNQQLLLGGIKCITPVWNNYIRLLVRRSLNEDGTFYLLMMLGATIIGI